MNSNMCHLCVFSDHLGKNNFNKKEINKHVFCKDSNLMALIYGFFAMKGHLKTIITYFPLGSSWKKKKNWGGGGRGGGLFISVVG